MAEDKDQNGMSPSDTQPTQPTEPAQPTQPTVPVVQDHKPKFDRTIITDAGRHMFLEVGDGQGTLVYTRAVLSPQRMIDKNGEKLTDESIRQVTELAGVPKEGELQISPVANNEMTVTASFSNKDQKYDFKFSTIGWYARIDQFMNGDMVRGQEVLYAITLTTRDAELLPASPPNHRSTQVITVDLNVTLSDAANVSMVVNETGVVYRSELESWITKIKTWIEQAAGNITVSVGTNGPFRQDANHNIMLPAYTAQEVDSKIRKLLNEGGGSQGGNTGDHSGTGGGDRPIDTDNLTKDEFDQIQHNYANRIKYLTLNAVLGQRFTSVEDAKEYESNHTDRIGLLKDVNVPIPQKALPQSAVPETSDNDKNEHYTSDDLSKKLAEFNNRIKFLEDTVVIGRHFTNKSDAKDWAAQHQEYLAYIEDSTDSQKPATADIPSVQALFAAVDKPAEATQPTAATQSTQATHQIDSKGNIMYYTKAEFDAKFAEFNNSLMFLENNALLSRDFDTQDQVNDWESKQANYIGFTR